MSTIRTLARAVAVLLVSAASLQAQTAFVGSDGAFGTPAGYIYWGSLGPSGTTIGNPFTINATGIPGLSANVSQAGASSFERRDQPSGWGGNFANGDQLLWTQGTNGPMSLIFSSAISAFGTQIQQDQYGPFVATISAYDAANVLLGTYLVNGTSNGNGDNSAIFLGISSTTGISRIDLSVDTQDFAINEVRLNGNVTATPEPATLLLMTTGLGLLGVLRRRSVRL